MYMVGILGVSKARLSKQYHFTISQPKGMELLDNCDIIQYLPIVLTSPNPTKSM